MRVLDVYLDGRLGPAGILVSRDDRSTAFAYEEAYIAHPEAIPLSLSMPFDLNGYGDAATRAFFENLLPENDQMRRLMDLNAIDRGDFVALLELLGADCPGAISCVPRGEGPVKNPGVLDTDYIALPGEELTDFVRRMARGETLPDEIRDPSPVAGYQQKMALTRLPDGGFALPRPGTGAPTTHILKTPQVQDRRDAELERASAQLARAVGLDVVVPETPEFGGHPTILVERYDRLLENGTVRRLHQEDFAQALGLPASLKYERNGGPGRAFTAAGVHDLLQRTAVPAKALREFLKLTIFNACVGNADNHAKNHSLLYARGAIPDLAPAYDLLPTRMSANLRPEMGFSLGAAEKVEDITAADMAVLLRTFGFSDAAALRFAQGDLVTLMLALDRAAADREIAPKDLDDMIGANLERVSAACGLELDLRERDHFQLSGGGWLSGS